MRDARVSLLLFSATVLLLSGCAASHPYYAVAPPPPPPVYGYREQPPLISVAQQQGFRAGTDDGARDAYERRAYRPEHNRRFHDAPGYDPRLGPYEPYRDAFRDAYLRGYANGYRRG